MLVDLLDHLKSQLYLRIQAVLEETVVGSVPFLFQTFPSRLGCTKYIELALLF